MESLQKRYAPQNRCFGCGPANERGLRLESYPSEKSGELVAEWKAQREHEAFDGVVNGGIIGALLDCHSNWVATHALMTSRGLDRPPCTVTADFHVTLRRPTPTAATMTLRGHPVATEGDKVIVEATIEAAGKITATCRGTFVAVQEGHPAFHRW